MDHVALKEEIARIVTCERSLVEVVSRCLRRASIGVDDVLQETYICACRRLPRLATMDPCRRVRWVKNAVRCTARNLERSASREKRNAVLFTNESFDQLPFGSERSVLDSLCMREDAERRLEAISEMSPRKAILLIDVDVREVALSRVARSLGISRKRATRELKEAREEVERKLREHGMR